MKFLSQPYPISFNPVRKIWVSLGVGGFIFLFLFLFQPFGLGNIQPSSRILQVCLGYGAVTLGCMLFTNLLLPLIVPKFFQEERWTVGREILSFAMVLVLIASGNLLLSVWMGFFEFTVGSFMLSVWFVLLLGIFPAATMILLRQSRLFRKHESEARDLEQFLDHEPAPPSVKTITLQGEGKKDSLPLHPEEVVLVTAADNYCEVHYLQEGTPRKALLRASLKDLEGQLQGVNGMQRVHRSHLVQLHHVTGVTGNSQGLRLQLRGMEGSIPVSRTYQETLREQLRHLLG